jgi:hypothetical protein
MNQPAAAGALPFACAAMERLITGRPEGPPAPPPAPAGPPFRRPR